MRHKRFAIKSWIWLTALALIISLHFWFPSWERRPMHDTYSTERGGKKAMFLLTERRFGEGFRNVKSPSGAVNDLYSDDLFCLLGPIRYPDSREWDVLLDWVRDGGSLVIAPRYDQPSLAIKELGLNVEPRIESELELDLNKLMKEAERRKKMDEAPVKTTLFGGGELRWRSFGKIVGDGAEVIVEQAGEPQAVIKPYGKGRVLLVASDQVFSNASLAWKDNGILALRLLESVSGPDSFVTFDEYFNTVGAPKIVGLLLAPLLRPITIQIVVVLLLFAWCGSRRFGRALPQTYSARHDIADHTDALGNMYYRSNSGQSSVRYYFEQLRMELRLKYLSASDPQAMDSLARRTGMESEYLRDLLQRAEAATKAPKLKRKTAAGIIRELATFRAAARKDSAAG